MFPTRGPVRHPATPSADGMRKERAFRGGTGDSDILQFSGRYPHLAYIGKDSVRMSSSPGDVHAYRFGPFRLIVSDRILEHDGERVHLTPKVVDTLLVLIRSAPQVVSKETLIQAVWPDVIVVESGL